MKGNSWRGITLSILLLLAISEVMGTDYWISPFGSDSNNGLSASTPFKTFKYALTRVSSTGVLYVLPGLYSGYFFLEIIIIIKLLFITVH